MVLAEAMTLVVEADFGTVEGEVALANRSMLSAFSTPNLLVATINLTSNAARFSQSLHLFFLAQRWFLVVANLKATCCHMVLEMA